MLEIVSCPGNTPTKINGEIFSGREAAGLGSQIVLFSEKICNIAKIWE